MKKAVITSGTGAIRELFDEDDVLLVRPAEPKEIAMAIIKLKDEPHLITRLAENGHNKFLKLASSKILGQEVKNIVLSSLNLYEK